MWRIKLRFSGLDISCRDKLPCFGRENCAEDIYAPMEIMESVNV